MVLKLLTPLVPIAANTDFTPVTNGEINFLYGETAACGEVVIHNNNIFENDEEFYFSFSEIVSQDLVVIDMSPSTVTIKDDDGESTNLWTDCIVQTE